MKPHADLSHFEALDLRVGRVLSAVRADTRKPTYRLEIDFGAELGVKISCAALLHYPADEIVGRLLIAVVNLGPRTMGPEISEVFVLGVPDADGNAMFLTPAAADVPLGGAVF